MKTLTKSFAILFMILLTVSCSKEEILPPMNEELSDAVLKGSIGESFVELNLSGETHFPSYAVKEHRVISPYDMNKLACEATLTHLGGQNYVLMTEEYFGPMLFRKVIFEVKMTPSGVFKFYWPKTWEELDMFTGMLVPSSMDLLSQMHLHTGCVMYGGAGINKGTIMYNGTFDGTNFKAFANFMGKQDMLGIIEPFYTGEPLIEGPVQFEFSIELVVQ